MKTRSIRMLAATSVLGMGLGVAGPSIVPAGASPARRAVNIYTKTRCNQAINERLFVLAISEQRIAQVKRLTAEQKAAEIAGIDEVQAHLSDVNRPALNNAHTTSAVRTACQAIYQDNRVYAVVIPQLFASVRIDEFGNAFDRFDPMIAQKKADGADTTEVEALVASSKAHVDTAAGIVSSITPDSFNADPAGTRARFDQTVGELNAALGDLLRGIVAYSHLTVTAPTA
ncbi:MAG: hypothetical protein R2698_02425 [Microthrixaceae bacterium]